MQDNGLHGALSQAAKPLSQPNFPRFTTALDFICKKGKYQMPKRFCLRGRLRALASALMS